MKRLLAFLSRPAEIFPATSAAQTSCLPSLGVGPRRPRRAGQALSCAVSSHSTGWHRGGVAGLPAAQGSGRQGSAATCLSFSRPAFSSGVKFGNLRGKTITFLHICKFISTDLSKTVWFFPHLHICAFFSHKLSDWLVACFIYFLRFYRLLL